MVNLTRYSHLFLTAALAIRLSSSPASATTYYWDPLGTAGAGGGAGTWDGMGPGWATANPGGADVAWVNGFDAVFSGTAGIVTLGAPITVGAISVSTAAYTITTGTDAPLTVTGGITVSNSTGATNINGTGGLILSGDQTISVTSGMNITTVLSGSDVLTKSGAGSLGLSGTNAFSGKFVVTAGLLGINSDAALGADPSTFQADNITLNGGGLVAGMNFTSPVNFSNPGNISLDANRGITLGANGGTFRVGFGTDVLTVNGAITGVGALTKIDSGVLVLNADNTYQGATNITGILQVGTGGTTGTLGAGKITFGSGNGNFLNFNRSDNVTLENAIGTGTRANLGAVAGEKVTFNGAFTGTGEVWIQGPGTVAINANANSSRATSTVMLGGILQVSDLTRTTASALGSGNVYFGQASTLATGTGLSYTGDSVATDAFQNVQTPYASLEVTNADTTLSVTNVFKGSNATCLLTKLGLGTLSLEGVGDNTRLRVQVESGTLLLGKTSSSSVHAIAGVDALIQNGGTVRITGANGDQIYDPSTVQINGGTFDLNGQNESFDGLNSSASGGVITNTATGTTSTLTLGTNNGSSTYTGQMQDGAGVVAIQKSGSGSLTLSGSNMVSGGVSLTKGRLIVSGSLTGSVTEVVGGVLGGTGTTGDLTVFGGTVSPGANATRAAIGTLSTGTLDMSSGGTYEASLDTGALASSLEAIEGDLSLGFSAAVLTLAEVGTATANANDTKFTIMSYTGQWDGGTFSFGSLGAIEESETFTFGLNTYRMTYDEEGAVPGVKYVTLTVVVPEPAAGGFFLGGMVLLGGWLRPRRITTRALRLHSIPS